MIADLKRVASEMGKVPTRDEYHSQSKYSRHIIGLTFGGFTPFLHAAGFKVGKEKTKNIFATDVRTLLTSDKPKTPPKTEAPKAPPDTNSQQSRVLVIGDTHFPFVDTDALSALYLFAEQVKPDCIVQIGDLYDFFAHSKFPRTHLTFDPQQEAQLGFEMASAMWKTLKAIVPDASCHQLLGNHDARPLKRILETYPEGEMFFSIEKYFQFPGVQVYFDTRQELVLGDAIFLHGHKSSLGAHRDYNLANSVCGHSHQGGVSYRQIGGKILWELNAGFLGDASSKALSYTPQRITKWTLGWGYIDEWGPRFVPL